MTPRDFFWNGFADEIEKLSAATGFTVGSNGSTSSKPSAMSPGAGTPNTPPTPKDNATTPVLKQTPYWPSSQSMGSAGSRPSAPVGLNPMGNGATIGD